MSYKPLALIGNRALISRVYWEVKPRAPSQALATGAVRKKLENQSRAMTVYGGHAVAAKPCNSNPLKPTRSATPPPHRATPAAPTAPKGPHIAPQGHLFWGSGSRSR